MAEVEIQSPDIALGYFSRNARRLTILATTAAALVAAVVLDISVGPGGHSLRSVLSTILSPATADIMLQVVVWDYRLPIAIMAVSIGAMLGFSGAGMQTILANPLADPFVLGISAAASVGAAVVIVTGWSVLPGVGGALVTVNAFAFALAASLILFFLTRIRGVNSETMILVGIALMFTCNAVIGLVQYRATEVQLSQIVFWMLGSLSRASWPKIGICLAVLTIALPYFLVRSWALTTLRLGDERAESLGVRVDRLRLETLAVVSLLAAVSVSFVGTIGFVGLVGPHMARLLVGEDQRFFIPVSALMSGVMMSLASTLSKAVVPGVIYPIGIVTALIGVPFFLSLVMSVRRKGF